jgi:hypothetical protein
MGVVLSGRASRHGTLSPGPAVAAVSTGPAEPGPVASVTLRSWTRRYRRGRLETLGYTAVRVLRSVEEVASQWRVRVNLQQPVLVHNGDPVVYLSGEFDFWQMVQQTDIWPQDRVVLRVLVHRRTLADPWECTCVLTRSSIESLWNEPVVLRSATSPETQVYGRFWQELAWRCDLVRAGPD